MSEYESDEFESPRKEQPSEQEHPHPVDAPELRESNEEAPVTREDHPLPPNYRAKQLKKENSGEYSDDPMHEKEESHDAREYSSNYEEEEGAPTKM